MNIEQQLGRCKSNSSQNNANQRNEQKVARLYTYQLIRCPLDNLYHDNAILIQNMHAPRLTSYLLKLIGTLNFGWPNIVNPSANTIEMLTLLKTGVCN